jgi:hypothetical protein
MFSVICPTMWKAAELEVTLPLLDNSPHVGEILLINNDINHTPGWFGMRPWRKVKSYNPSSNIFVNPAFNIGVKSSTYDKICLLQDDIVFDPNIFYHLGLVVNKNVGVIGTDASCMFQVLDKQYLIPEPINNIRIEPVILPIIFGYAPLMVLHKHNYIPIDETLKIHLGEEWIVQTHLKFGLTPLVMKNIKFRLLNMCTTTTSTPEFLKYRDKEEKKHAWIREQLDEICSQ